MRSRHYGAIPGKDGNNNAHNTHQWMSCVHLSLFQHIPTTSSSLALGPGCSLYAPVDPGTMQFRNNCMNKRHSDCTSNSECNLCLLWMQIFPYHTWIHVITNVYKGNWGYYGTPVHLSFWESSNDKPDLGYKLQMVHKQHLVHKLQTEIHCCSTAQSLLNTRNTHAHLCLAPVCRLCGWGSIPQYFSKL